MAVSRFDRPCARHLVLHCREMQESERNPGLALKLGLFCGSVETETAATVPARS